MKNENNYVRKNDGKPRMSLIPQDELFDIIKVFEMGAKKYGDHSYKNAADPVVFLDSASRHLKELHNNNLIDEESGLPHSAHICANMLMFAYHKK